MAFHGWLSNLRGCGAPGEPDARGVGSQRSLVTSAQRPQASPGLRGWGRGAGDALTASRERGPPLCVPGSLRNLPGGIDGASVDGKSGWGGGLPSTSLQCSLPWASRG